MAAPSENEENDNFKAVYKYYKRRDRPLNTDRVLNFSCISSEHDHVEPFALNVPDTQFPGLKPVCEWKAFQLKGNPGLIVIPNPFESWYQRYWVVRCLLDFPVKPNTTNLEVHMERPSHIWEACATNGSPDLKKDSLLMRLRWATLGYQYEWNTKEYFSDRLQQFPDDLALLCGYVAATLGHPGFSSEAGIVNYYRMDSTLMGHTDVSELEKAAPLISFSFGQDCIFLSGGATKATEPIPLFLQSGDICLMTGPARLSYHAVPRILNATEENFHRCFRGDSCVTMASDAACGYHGNVSHNNVQGMYSSEFNKSTIQNGTSHVDTASENVCDNEHGDSGVDIDEDPYNTTITSIDPKPKFLSDDSDEKIMATLSSQGTQCRVDELRQLMDSVIGATEWAPFEKYLKITRLNVNVRQVLKEGLTLKPSPEKIVPLPCPGIKT